MPETITLHALDLSGETTLKLFLRKNDGSLLNAGGDDLTEISSSGVFQATLAESRSGLGTLNGRVCLGTETADNLVWDGPLEETSTTLGETGTASITGGLTTEQNTALLGIAAAVSGGSKVEATGRVAAGGKVTAYIGDDFKVSRGTALTIPVSDPAGTLQTKLTTITAANLRFAVSAPGKAGSLITGTISGITTSGSGADRLCLIAIEITNCGASLPPGEQYFYQIDQIQGSTDDFVEVEGKFLLKQRARAV